MLAWIVPPPQTPEKHYPRCNQICQAGRKKGWNVSCHVKTIWKCKSYVMNILIHAACEYWTILCSIFHPPFTTNTLKIHIFVIQKKDIYWNQCVLSYITVWLQLINTICDNRLAPNPLAELPLLWNLLHLSTTYLHGLHPPPTGMVACRTDKPTARGWHQQSRWVARLCWSGQAKRNVSSREYC